MAYPTNPNYLGGSRTNQRKPRQIARKPARSLTGAAQPRVQLDIALTPFGHSVMSQGPYKDMLPPPSLDDALGTGVFSGLGKAVGTGGNSLPTSTLRQLPMFQQPAVPSAMGMLGGGRETNNSTFPATQRNQLPTDVLSSLPMYQQAPPPPSPTQAPMNSSPAPRPQSQTPPAPQQMPDMGFANETERMFNDAIANPFNGMSNGQVAGSAPTAWIGQQAAAAHSRVQQQMDERAARSRQAHRMRPGWNYDIQIPNGPRTASGKPAPSEMNGRPLVGYTDTGITNGIVSPIYGRSQADKEFDDKFYAQQHDRDARRQYYRDHPDVVPEPGSGEREIYDQLQRMNAQQAKRDQYLAGVADQRRQRAEAMGMEVPEGASPQQVNGMLRSADMMGRQDRVTQNAMGRAQQRQNRMFQRQQASIPRPMTAMDYAMMNDPQTALAMRGQNIQMQQAMMDQQYRNATLGIQNREIDANKRRNDAAAAKDEAEGRAIDKYNSTDNREKDLVDMWGPDQTTWPQEALDEYQAIREGRAGANQGSQGDQGSQGYGDYNKTLDTFNNPESRKNQQLSKTLGFDVSTAEWGDMTLGIANYHVGGKPKMSDSTLSDLVDYVANNELPEMSGDPNEWERKMGVYNSVHDIHGDPLPKETAMKRVRALMEFMPKFEKNSNSIFYEAPVVDGYKLTQYGGTASDSNGSQSWWNKNRGTPRTMTWVKVENSTPRPRTVK